MSKSPMRFVVTVSEIPDTDKTVAVNIKCYPSPGACCVNRAMSVLLDKIMDVVTRNKRKAVEG